LDNNPSLNRVIVPGNTNWDSDSLDNLVASLCDDSQSHNGEACIDGNGSRAAAIIDHSNNCGIDCCNHSSCTASPTLSPTLSPSLSPALSPSASPTLHIEEEENDSSDLGTGAIAGIAVGGTAFVSVVGYIIYRYTSTSKSSSSSTTVGSLIF